MDATERNKDLVRRLYATLMAEGDTAAADEMLAEGYVDHDIPGPFPPDREGLKQAVMGVRAAFPDVKPELYEIVAEDDLVAVRVEAGGTHTGAPFMDIPPSGSRIRWKEMHVFRCRDGRIVEHRGVFDLLAILQQLGAIPGPA
jgi:predicted ester cyclase